MTLDDFKRGQQVKFKPGRSTTTVQAKVTGKDDTGIRGIFLITKDADGKERKVRPGACTKL